MATGKTLLATAISLTGSVFLIRSIANDLVPQSVQAYLRSALADLLPRFSSRLTVFIDEFDGMTVNRMYKAAEIYLATKQSPRTRRLRVVKQDDSAGLDVTMECGEEIDDVFQRVQFRWRLQTRKSNLPISHNGGRRRYRVDSTPSKVRCLELTFHKKHKDLALTSYLPYVLEKSEAIKKQSKTLKIHTNEENMWIPAHLHHPARFDTMAMEAQQKEELRGDLARFVGGKEFYKRIGKAWKRGYLLHGPPGTGKSSLIAAIANELRFDVYDLELTQVRSNSMLRSLLIGTSNRSILVVEDIDCSLEFQNRKGKKKASKEKRSPDDDEDNAQVTLSGLLNFVDGLWSSCGDERIIVFTTNYKDRLDPALLRPGRMDVHVRMTYCTPAGFRVLASNYHCLDQHLLFEGIEGLIREVEVTPAEVAEELMKSDDPEIALRGLIEFIQTKKDIKACAPGNQEGARKPDDEDQA